MLVATNKSIRVWKFNPYHGARGLFVSGGTGGPNTEARMRMPFGGESGAISSVKSSKELLGENFREGSSGTLGRAHAEVKTYMKKEGMVVGEKAHAGRGGGVLGSDRGKEGWQGELAKGPTSLKNELYLTYVERHAFGRPPKSSPEERVVQRGKIETFIKGKYPHLQVGDSRWNPRPDTIRISYE